MENWRENLLKEITSVNDYTDVRKVMELRERTDLINTLDPANQPILEAVRKYL